MSGDGDAAETPVIGEHEEESTYRPPAQKTLQELVQADAEDESLLKYKQALLGQALSGEQIIVEPNNPKNVIVKRLALLVEGRPDVVLDLTQNLGELKKKTFTVKEGIQYQIRIDFYVQREIVTGLKYVQKITRLGAQVEKMSQMVGSYAPKPDMQSYTTPKEEMPSGMLARGSYGVKSLFTDDDQHEHLKWEWSFEIKKDWED